MSRQTGSRIRTVSRTKRVQTQTASRTHKVQTNRVQTDQTGSDSAQNKQGPDRLSRQTTPDRLTATWSGLTDTVRVRADCPDKRVQTRGKKI